LSNKAVKNILRTKALMPTADEILKALTLISNKYIAVAISWHAIVVLFLIYYFSAKQKLSNRFVNLLFSLLLLSVSVLAWTAGNPFNGTLFLAASSLLFILGIKKKELQTAVEPRPWPQIAGSLIVLSGFFYPHFLEASWWTYSYSAPIGLVPCPTLLVITGLYLILPVNQSRSWVLTLVLLDAFYGLFGVFKLNVYLDLILIAATIVLILQPGIIKKPRQGATIQTLPTGNRA
jgi:hypothetical protein